jgi:hypothetical protein
MRFKAADHGAGKAQPIAFALNRPDTSSAPAAEPDDRNVDHRSLRPPSSLRS